MPEDITVTSHKESDENDMRIQHIEAMLLEMVTLTREIHVQSQKTRRYIYYGHIINVVKFVLIIGPIILAIIFLPPLLREALSTYNELLGGGTGQTLFESEGFFRNIFMNN